MEKRKILVCGATGRQGGSVAKFLLKSTEFHPRCLTRNPDGQVAKVLAREGAEIVKGDFNDKESLIKSMQGVYGVFANTNYWEHCDSNLEIQQGKNICDAAKEVGVQHFILSSKENMAKMTGNSYSAPMYEKAVVADYCKELDLPWTIIRLAFYMENFFNLAAPIVDDHGNYNFIMPMNAKPLDMFSVSDTGAIIYEILNNPKEWIHKDIGIAADSLEISKVCQIFTKYTGKDALYRARDYVEYQRVGIANADKLANMYRFQVDFAGKLKDIELTKKIYPRVKTFDEWMNENKGVFKV